MSFDFCQFLGYAQGAQGYALVNLNVIPDLNRFADDDPGAMVDAETFPYTCSGVDIYSCLTMCMFCHYTRDQWYAELIELVSEPVNSYCKKKNI